MFLRENALSKSLSGNLLAACLGLEYVKYRNAKSSSVFISLFSGNISSLNYFLVAKKHS